MDIYKFVFWVIVSTVIFNCNTETVAIEDEGFITINGSGVYYKTIGQGDPLIVIHGGPVLDHTYFLPQFEALKDDYQLIFYDQRVCGKSSIDIDSSTMNLDGFIDDIKLLKDSLGLDKPHILGHSWGGLLAMGYAIKYPDSYNKLILSNCMPPSVALFGEESSQLGKRVTREDSLKRVEIMQSEMMKEYPSVAIQKIMMMAFKTQFKDTTKLSELNLTIPHDYMERSQKFFLLGGDISSFDYTAELSSITQPTLVLYGDTEPAVEISASTFIDNIKDVELKVMEDCGHFPFVEKPEEYFSFIKDFLK